MVVNHTLPVVSDDEEKSVDLAELDVGTLSLFFGQAFVDEVQRRLAAKGFTGLRVSHGYVIQHVVAAPRTISELAERMGVTQQAASKATAELVALGYLESQVDATDARVRLIGLSSRGHAAVRAARRARAALERELDEAHGAAELRKLRKTLGALLRDLGGLPAVRARRVRPPR